MENLHTLFDLTGKVAVVTGGYTGLGYDMACALSEYGATVVISSRSREKAENVARSMSETYHNRVIGLNLDQSNYDSCQTLADRVHEECKRIDILINNAGGGSGKGKCNFLERNPELMRSMIETNLLGPLFCCQSFGRYMVDQNSGSIINIASIAGITGRDRSMYHKAKKEEQPVEYAASKGGIIGMTLDLAAYMAPFNVRVNAISPGGFDKGELTKAFVQAYSKRTPLGHMGVLNKEIMGTALFLASEAASYITGQNIVVDGGFSTCR
jgi:gluconate 5-dehydrogenase